MFLSLLSKEEKETFIELAYHVSTLDSNYSKEEQQIIESYCNEMQISITVLNKNSTIHSIIDKLVEKSNVQSKKIIIFEIIGLAMCDSTYDDVERKFITELSDKFNLNQDYMSHCETLINKYLKLQKNINSIVIG